MSSTSIDAEAAAPAAASAPGMPVCAARPTTDLQPSAVWDALATVRDPELDRPLTELKFISDVTITGGDVRVRLRLPTYFCAPNFAYLMVVDALDAVEAVPGVSSATVTLDDHYASEEINAGAARRSDFRDTFPGEAVDELADLRRTFRRKAHLACIERAARRLLEIGWSLEGLGEARLGDLPESTEAQSLRRRRTDLGLPAGPDASLIVDDDGVPVADDLLAKRLRFAKAVRISIEANGQYCTGLLHARYGVQPD